MIDQYLNPAQMEVNFINARDNVRRLPDPPA